MKNSNILATSINILRAYCQLAAIPFTDIDGAEGLVLHIQYKDKHLVVSSNVPYPINPGSSVNFTRDKAWTYMHLAQNGYPIPEGKHFFTKNSYKNFEVRTPSIEAAINYAQSLTYPVFVKPNRGASGKLARLVSSDEDLLNHFAAIAKSDHVALVQKPITKPEFGLFVLGDRVEFTYLKSPSSLVGDGQQSIRQLIEAAGENSPKKVRDSFFSKQIAQLGLRMDDILPLNQTLSLSPNSNLNTGGQMRDYTEQINPQLEQWAVNLIQLFGLKIAGIDVFGDSLENPEQLIVLEINSMPTLASLYLLGYHKKVYDIWSKIMVEYFGELPCLV